MLSTPTQFITVLPWQGMVAKEEALNMFIGDQEMGEMGSSGIHKQAF